MASGSPATVESSVKHHLLSLPLEIRMRIYHYCFQKPHVAIWNHRRATTLGYDTRSAEDAAYRAAVADDFIDSQYEYKHEGKEIAYDAAKTIGWLEDYTPLLLTCRRIRDEARDVLGSMMHLKVLFRYEPPRDPPRGFSELYYGRIRQLTLMFCPAWHCGDEDYVRRNRFDQVSKMPSLECVRIVIAEIFRTNVLVKRPKSAAEYVDFFMGATDDMLVETIRDNLISDSAGRVNSERAAALPVWLKEVLFDKKRQSFQVLRREIFNVYLVTDEEDHDMAHTQSRHAIKMILEFDAISFEIQRRRWIGIATRNGKMFVRCPLFHWDVTLLDSEPQLKEFLETQVWPGFDQGADSSDSSESDEDDDDSEGYSEDYDGEEDEASHRGEVEDIEFAQTQELTP